MSFDFEDYLKGKYNKQNSFLQFDLYDTGKNVLSTTYLFPTNLKDAEGISDPVVVVSYELALIGKDKLRIRVGS